jgi:hypothetical protein
MSKAYEDKMRTALIANSWLTSPRVDNQNTVGETLCQREHASECDINVQIKRFQSLGISPFQPFDQRHVADLTELAGDLIQANNVIVAARDAFDSLDDRIKQRFSGSPALFLDFMSNLPNNFDEAVSLGLITERPVVPSPVAGKAPKGPAASAAQGSGADAPEQP